MSSFDDAFDKTSYLLLTTTAFSLICVWMIVDIVLDYITLQLDMPPRYPLMENDKVFGVCQCKTLQL